MKKETIESTRVVIIGAGNVGATTAYTLMVQGIASEIVLIDVNKDKCAGEVLDLVHGISFVKPTRIWAGNYEDCQEADIVCICAGAAQKPGQSRLELTEINAKIVSQITKNVIRYTKKAIILVVTNPLDAMTYVALKISNLPKFQVFGTGTSLDSSRFRWLLAEKFGIAAISMQAFLIGEHGDSSVPICSHTSVLGKNINELPEYNSSEIEEICKKIKNAAYEIISKKEATFYAIALAICEIIRAILYDENRVLLTSFFLTGQYGLKNVCLSLPTVIGRTGIKKIIEINLTSEELDSLKRSAEIIQNTIKEINIENIS